MLPQHLYDVAKKVELSRQGTMKLAQDMLKFHLLRYKYFVDASPVGFGCTYAKLSQKYFEEEDELPKVINRLKDMRKVIDHCIEELENVRAN